jgi:hypothetical protein
MAVVRYRNRPGEIDRTIGAKIGTGDFVPKTCNMRKSAASTRQLSKRTQHSHIGHKRKAIRLSSSNGPRGEIRKNFATTKTENTSTRYRHKKEADQIWQA